MLKSAIGRVATLGVEVEALLGAGAADATTTDPCHVDVHPGCEELGGRRGVVMEAERVRRHVRRHAGYGGVERRKAEAVDVVGRGHEKGVRKIRLLTNNPRKLIGLGGYGLEVVEQVPIRIRPNRHNRRYLDTKRDRLGHLL